MPSNEQLLVLFFQTTLLLHEIASNLLSYCRVVVTRSADADSAALFAPDLAESSFGNPAYGNGKLLFYTNIFLSEPDVRKKQTYTDLPKDRLRKTVTIKSMLVCHYTVLRLSK